MKTIAEFSIRLHDQWFQVNILTWEKYQKQTYDYPAEGGVGKYVITYLNGEPLADDHDLFSTKDYEFIEESIFDYMEGAE